MYQWILIAAMSNPWTQQTTPSHGPAEAIGGYAAGCLQGAIELPEHGLGYQILRPQEKRYFGHPIMEQYVLDLARQAKKVGLPDILVGDMAMAKGGPFPTGHRSHQSGLDTDFWFRFAKKTLSSTERNHIEPLEMVDFKSNHVNKNFGQQQITLLKLAAQDPRVERIFVNPPIKQAMCEQYAASNPAWLGKLRPWFGHSAHFHVRLHCPVGSKDCEPQKAPPPGTGCGYELQSWLTKPAMISSTPAPNPIPKLPGRCELLLSNKKR
ncbi:penicillin-insensitive murein endopeptidase [Tolumonas lignilytica]|uniref:penicillin-insensitive murein endopeptidase n=1 Tax=Tolumonas lignilytica TaxID=1283284 RepID=UPI000467714B|nr:penicillin-insensitive murein endopeptidase [Tolumonas lignilytica]